MNFMSYRFVASLLLCCFSFILKSAEEKPTRKKTALTIAIPQSKTIGNFLLIQDFTSASQEPVAPLVYPVPRYGAPIPQNHHRFDFVYRTNMIRIFSLTHQTIPKTSNSETDEFEKPLTFFNKKLRSRL